MGCKDGAAKEVNSTYDKAGRRITLIDAGNLSTATYAYDARDRGTQIQRNGKALADYTWLGNALSRRDTTSDTAYVIGGITDKVKFKTEFQRDGILRVTKVVNAHLTRDMADSGYENLGSWTYSYDSAGNPLDAVHTGRPDALAEALAEPSEHPRDQACRDLARPRCRGRDRRQPESRGQALPASHR